MVEEGKEGEGNGRLTPPLLALARSSRASTAAKTLAVRGLAPVSPGWVVRKQRVFLPLLLADFVWQAKGHTGSAG